MGRSWEPTDAVRVSELLARAAMAHARFVARVRRRLGLGSADYAALQQLEAAEELPVGELAARIGLSRPAATALVDRLVRQGMLERVPDESDRRRVIVRRAEAGRGITAPEVEALVHELDEFTRAFTSEECDAIARYLSGVVEIVERHVG